MMKRRNVDLIKIRRPMKSKKVSEGSYSNVFGFLKFLIVWGLVLLADFILEFRFEYLYPVWLLYRSVQDSYKYQGVLLTMLFLALAIGTDILCFVLIPVQWLFFAASSYVWVQYVWHTDRGICLSSIALWILFVYVEAALRMKDQRSLPYNVDLCRPFAAHCIGYPVVTLGYGIKTAASESLRKRTRDKVKRTNHHYTQILQQALPEELREQPKPATSQHLSDLKSDIDSSNRNKDDISDTSSEASESCTTSTKHSGHSSANNTTAAGAIHSSHGGSHQHINSHNSSPNIKETQQQQHSGSASTPLSTSKSNLIEEFDLRADQESKELQQRRRNINELSTTSAEETENLINDSKSKVSKDLVSKKLNNKRNRGGSGHAAITTTTSATTQQHTVNNAVSGGGNINGHVVTSNGDIGVHGRSEQVIRLESDVKRLKADLQSSKNSESELRSQLHSKVSEEQELNATLAQIQQDNETLQNKLHNLVMSRQQDKQNLSAMEKKYQDEKRQREKTEQQLLERKSKKPDEAQSSAKSASPAGRSSAAATDCVGNCRSRLKETEDSVSKLRWDMERRDEQLRQLEHEAQQLRKYKEANVDKTEVLMSALAAMQDKTAHLESSLSAEQKIKMELFSALGEVKRQMEIQRRLLAAKETEIASLRSHITEALALVPSSMYTDQPLAPGQYTTPKLGSPTMVNCGQPAYMPSHHDMVYTNPHYNNCMPPPAIPTPPPPSVLHMTSHNRYSPPCTSSAAMTSGSPSPCVTPVSDADNVTSAPSPAPVSSSSCTTTQDYQQQQQQAKSC